MASVIIGFGIALSFMFFHICTTFDSYEVHVAVPALDRRESWSQGIPFRLLHPERAVRHWPVERQVRHRSIERMGYRLLQLAILAFLRSALREGGAPVRPAI